MSDLTIPRPPPAAAAAALNMFLGRVSRNSNGGGRGSTAPCRLVSIPASPYVEKARWALERARVPFEEEAHLPLMHYAATLPFGGRSVPLLRRHASDPWSPLRDSSDILRWLQEDAGAGWLFPNEEAVELEAYFSRKLGPHARRFAYWHLFKPDEAAAAAPPPSPSPPSPPPPADARQDAAPRADAAGAGSPAAVTAWSRTERADLALRVLTDGVESETELALAPHALPALRQALLRSLNINARKSDESLARVEAVFDEVSDILAQDRRRFLGGAQFTGADLTFASMASVVVMPEQNFRLGQLVSREVFFGAAGGEARERVERLRASPAGRLVERCYAEERLA